jgi:signal transduction histidine kinase
MARSRKRLIWCLYLMLATLALVASASAAWLNIRRDRALHDESVRRQAIATVEAAAAAVEEAFESGDLASVRGLVRAMTAERPPITSSLMASWSGRVIAHSDVAQEGKWAFDLLPPPSATLARSVVRSYAHTVQVTRALRVGDREPGSLRAEVTFPGFSADPWSAASPYAGMAAAFLVATAIAAALVARLASPLPTGRFTAVALKTGSRNIGAPPPSEPAPVEGLLESLPLALLVVDANARRVLYFNRRFCNLWGFPTRDAEIPFEAVVERCGLPPVEEPPGDETGVAEHELALDDGRTIRRLSASLRDDHGAEVGRAYLFEDVTLQRSAQSALDAARDAATEAARAKAAFLASMNEALRGPLQGIIRLTGQLLGTRLGKAQREDATRVLAAGEGLLALSEKIADYLRIDAGRLDDGDVDLDPHQLVADVAESIASVAHQKGIELTWWVDPQVPSALRGRDRRIREVLARLLANALRFTDSGDVFVQATVEERSTDRVVLRFEVTDTGAGIPPEKLQYLFKSSPDGSGGIGLLICKQLLDSVGGAIGARSQPRQGSVFWFTVPLATPPAPLLHLPHEEDALRRRRIMIVDDNARSRAVLERQLSSWLIPHETVSSGREALTRLRAAADYGAPYALAIVDSQMPEMDGIGLARAIRAEPKLAELPLLLLTSGERLHDLGAELGINVTLTKPVRPARLYTSIAATLLAGAPQATR